MIAPHLFYATNHDTIEHHFEYFHNDLSYYSPEKQPRRRLAVFDSSSVKIYNELLIKILSINCIWR